MSRKKLRLSVIGAGSIAEDHFRAIEECDCLSLAAVCDINEERAAAAARKYGAACFTDYREVPGAADADAVILNLPHGIHCEAAEFFAGAGMHVFVEKPMANTVSECDRMMTAAQENDVKLAVGHLQRFFSANMRVKEYVQSEKLGKLCMISERRTINYFDPSRPSWFWDKKAAGGGIVMNYGAHALDKFFYITGSRKPEVLSYVDNIKNNKSVEGHAQIMFGFENGVSATVTFCGYSFSGYDTCYYFTNGTLKVEGGCDLYVNTGDGWQLELQDDGKSMCRQLTEFYKYVNGELSAVTDGYYGRDIIAAIEKIYK